MWAIKSKIKKNPQTDNCSSSLKHSKCPPEAVLELRKRAKHCSRKTTAYTNHQKSRSADQMISINNMSGIGEPNLLSLRQFLKTTTEQPRTATKNRVTVIRPKCKGLLTIKIAL